MDDEVEAPVDALEASDDAEAEDDLGDGGYSTKCGGSVRTGNT